MAWHGMAWHGMAWHRNYDGMEGGGVFGCFGVLVLYSGKSSIDWSAITHSRH